MWTPIFNWLDLHYPVLFLVLIIIIVTVTVTVFFTTRYVHWKGRIEKIEDQIEHDIIPRLDRMEKNITALMQAVTAILIYLKGKDSSMDMSLFKAFSPIGLTDAGFAVLEALNGKEIVAQNLNELFKEIDAQQVATALDVQTYAPLAINNMAAGEALKKAKDFIYKNPLLKYYKEGEEFSIPLDLHTLNTVLGLYLRDQYLAAHPDIVPVKNSY